jgi:(p)ppGpp synthase/HD superfamily hydrolase
MSEVREIVEKAVVLAYRWHYGQTRKVTGLPYFVHPVAVAGLLEKVMREDPFWAGWSTHLNPILAAAYLHDVVEDCGITQGNFINAFGRDIGLEIYHLVIEVSEVSEPSMGNRKLRRALDAEHYSQASPAGQSIKLADIYDNAVGIARDDKKFWPTYQREMIELLPKLDKGHGELWKLAYNAVHNPAS